MSLNIDDSDHDEFWLPAVHADGHCKPIHANPKRVVPIRSSNIRSGWHPCCCGNGTCEARGGGRRKRMQRQKKKSDWIPVKKRIPGNKLPNDDDEDATTSTSAQRKPTTATAANQDAIPELTSLDTVPDIASASTSSTAPVVNNERTVPTRTTTEQTDRCNQPNVKSPDSAFLNLPSSTTTTRCAEGRTDPFQPQPIVHTNNERKDAEIRRLRARLLEQDATLQALRLRLYIAETRSATYAEALRHHVSTVDQNIVACTGTEDEPAASRVL